MKPLRIVIKALSISVFVFFAGSLFISKKFFLERNVFVEVSDTTAFKFAADYRQFNLWNPYFDEDPDANYTVIGSPGNNGQALSWDGKVIGKGKFEFVSQEPYKALYQKAVVENPVSGSFDNNMYFFKAYKGTIVTWTLSGECHSVIDKWKSLFYDITIGEDCQTGLDKFKEELESQELSKSYSKSDNESASL